MEDLSSSIDNLLPLDENLDWKTWIDETISEWKNFDYDEILGSQTSTQNGNLMDTTNDEKKLNIDDNLTEHNVLADELNVTMSEIFNNIDDFALHEALNNTNEDAFLISLKSVTSTELEGYPFVSPESANRLLCAPIINNQASRCKDYCSEENHSENNFSSEPSKLQDIHTTSSCSTTSPNKLEKQLPKELEKSPTLVKPQNSRTPSISLLKSKREILQAKTSLRELQTDAGRCKTNFQGRPKVLSRSIKYLESDGDSPRSESPQSYSGDERVSFVSDQINTLQYISNGAAAASRRTPDEHHGQRGRRLQLRLVVENSVFTDGQYSDIRRNTLNDHSYTLNESSSQHLTMDTSSESEEEIDVVSYNNNNNKRKSKPKFTFRVPKKPVSVPETPARERRGRGRPVGSTNANRKRALEDKMLPPAKRNRIDKEDKRTIHNRMERSRRNNLNNLQEQLKTEIPELATKAKASRASVLTEGESCVEIMDKSQKLLNNHHRLRLHRKSNFYSKIKSLRRQFTMISSLI